MPFDVKHYAGIVSVPKSDCFGPMDATIQVNFSIHIIGTSLTSRNINDVSFIRDFYRKICNFPAI